MNTSSNSISVYLTEMEECFVKPYGIWLKQSLFEATKISKATLDKIKADLDAIKPIGKPKEVTIDNVVPPAQQKVFAEKLPNPQDSQPVKGFKEKVKTAISSIKNVKSKKQLLQLAKLAIKNPNMQSLALTAISGAVGAGLLLSTANPILAGAVTGGLVGIARAKMTGKDWRSAARAGFKAATMGIAAGAIGGLAASMSANVGHMLVANTSTNAPLIDVDHQQTMEDNLEQLKQMARDGKIHDLNSYKDAIHNIVADNDIADIDQKYSVENELDLLVRAEAANAHGGKISGNSAEIEKAFVELENPEAAKGFDKDIENIKRMRDSMLTKSSNGIKESLALLPLFMLTETTDDDIRAEYRSKGYTDEQINSVINRYISTDKPTPRQKMMKWAEKSSIKIQTSDEIFNKTVNDIITKQGKEAAILYLQKVKSKMQHKHTIDDPPTKKVHPRRGLKLKASDGNTYTLSIGKDANDMLWQDESGEEASRRIDRELMSRVYTESKYEIYDGDILALIETSSSGSTSAGGIASIANPVGNTISRTPNLFGYIPEKRKKRKKRVR